MAQIWRHHTDVPCAAPYGRTLDPLSRSLSSLSHSSTRASVQLLLRNRLQYTAAPLLAGEKRLHFRFNASRLACDGRSERLTCRCITARLAALHASSSGSVRLQPWGPCFRQVQLAFQGCHCALSASGTTFAPGKPRLSLHAQKPPPSPGSAPPSSLTAVTAPSLAHTPAMRLPGAWCDAHALQAPPRSLPLQQRQRRCLLTGGHPLTRGQPPLTLQLPGTPCARGLHSGRRTAVLGTRGPRGLLEATRTRQPPLALQQRGYQALLALALAHLGRRAAVLGTRGPPGLLEALRTRQPPLALQQRGYQALLALALAHLGRRAAILLQQRRCARTHRPLHLLEDRAGAEEVLAGERLVQLAHLDAAHARHTLLSPCSRQS